MEFLTDSLTFFSDIGVLIATVVGTAIVALRGFIVRFGLAILAGLGRGAGAGLSSKFAGSGGTAGSQIDSRRMPASAKARHARQALWQASAREKRMETYLDAWIDLLAMRGGPFALSIYLYSLFHKGFQLKVARLQQRCREFDRLEDEAQRILQRYEADYERKCEPLRNEILDDQIELAKWKARHRRWSFKFWRKRWRYYKKRMTAVRRRLFVRRIILFRREYKLNLCYRSVIEPALKAVDQYEKAYLSHWVHSFEADLKSFRLTVVTGRLLEMICEKQNHDFLERLGLGEMPSDAARLRVFLQSTIESYQAGYGPEATLESLFETYLRLKLLNEPGLLERWGVNRVWLERYLPPPGALGVTQQRYEHMGSNRDWLSTEDMMRGGHKRRSSAA